MRWSGVKLFNLLAIFCLSDLAWGQGTSTQTLPTITIETRSVEGRKHFDFQDEGFTAIPLGTTSTGLQVYEKLGLVPGVTVRSQGTTAPSISIRGSVKSDRVLSLYNGIPLNTSDGLGARKLLVPNEVLSPLRIYKGPRSTRFGASAMGGAVAFQNKFLRSTELTVHGNSGIQGGGSAVIPLVAKRRYRFQASAFVDNTTGEFDFNNTHKAGSPSEFRTNNDSFLQRYTLHGQQRLGHWKLKQSLVLANESGTTPGSVLEPQVTSFNTLGGLGSLHMGRKVSNGLLVESQSSFLVIDSDFDNIGNELPDSSLQSRKFHQKLGVRVQPLRVWQITAELDYTFSTVDSLAGASSSLRENQTDISVFNKFLLNSNWSLDLGARRLISYEKNVFSAELRHQIRNTRTWLAYRQGYRAPSLSDRFANFPTFQGNPDLEPESSQHVEAGYRLSRKNNYELEGSAFAVFYDNFISSRSLDANSITPINQGSARSLGLDMGFKQFFGAWSFGIGGVFMNTYNAETDNSIQLTPDAEAQANAAYRAGPLILTVIQTLWSESLDTDPSGNTAVLDDGMRTDFELEFKLANWSIHSSIENMFDTPRESKFGFPDPQRQFKFSMRYVF